METASKFMLPAVGFVLTVVTGVCVIALFVSGALLSLGKPVDAVLLTIHKVAPVVAVVAMIAIIYLLNTKGIQ